MSTIVTLTTVWLNDADNPSDYLRLSGTAGLKRKPSVRGRTAVLAGGRLRGIRQAGVSDSWELDLPFRTPTEVEWITLRLGRILCARDDRGHKFFCWYLESPFDHYKHSKGAAATLVLDELTFSEVV